MTNTNRGALKSFMLILLGIILGIVLTAGGVAGFGYYAYKNYKMGKVNEWTGKEIFGDATINGEEFKLYDMSVSEFLQFIQRLQTTSKDMSLNDIDALFPALKVSSLLSSFIKDGKFQITYNGGTVVSMDEEQFKAIPLRKMVSSLTTEMKSTMTLESVEAFNLGIDFSAFPFVKGEDADGNPINTYISVGTGALDEFYKDKTDQLYYVGSDGEYYQATPDMIERVTAINFGKVNAGDGEGTELFFKAQGLLNLPLEISFKAITDNMDFDKLSLSDVEEKFGLNLKESDGEYNSIILKVKDKPFNKLASEMTETINSLTLDEVIDNIEGTRLEAVQYKRYSVAAAEEYNAANPDKPPVEAGDLMLDENGEKIESTISEIGAQIDNVRLEDFLPSYTPGTNAVMDKVAKLTISGINAEIVDDIVKGLTLAEAMGEIDRESVLYALQFKRFTAETAAEYNAGKPEAEHVKAGDKIPDGNGGYVFATIEELGSNIDYVPVGEIIGDSDNAVVNGISDILVKNLDAEINDAINNLSLNDVLGGIDNASKLASVKYLRYTDETAAQYNDGKPQSEWVAAGDYVLENGVKVLTKVNQLSEQIEYATLGDFIDEQQMNSKIMQSLKDVTVKNLGEKINALTVEDVMDTDVSGMVSALAIKKYTAEEAEAFNVGKPESQWVKEGDTVYEADGVTPVKTKINEISGQIDYIRLSSVITVGTESSEFMKNLMNSIGDSMLKDMDSALENVKVVDIMDVPRDAEGKVDGIWYFLLCDAATGEVNEDVTLKEMSTVFNSAPANIANATLGTLVDKGILNITNLDAEVREYTLAEFLQLINDKWSAIKPFV